MKRFLGAAAMLGMTSPLAAQTTLGFDDFDGGITFDSFFISPDNSGNLGFGDTPGVFPSSNFDVFGITNRNVLFDFADDSAGTFAGDSFGIAGVNKTDNFLGAADVLNPNNPSGIGFVDWTADISGFENLQVSIDMAALGNFDGDDSIQLFASFDNGVTDQLILDVVHDPGVFYEITMEGGTTYQTFFNSFFNGDDEWQALIDDGGPSVVVTDNFGNQSTISYRADDDGTTNGDTTANDGFIPVERLDPVTGATVFVEERAYNEVNSFGDFDNVEIDAYLEPLVVTTTSDPSGTTLNNDFQTITADIAGTGEDLLLTLIIESNGSQEVIALDNVLLTGDPITSTFLTGDLNGDNIVESEDLGLVLFFWGTSVADGQSPGLDWVNVDGVTFPFIDSDELGLVLNNWGNTAEILSQMNEITLTTGLSEGQVLALIPEPASLMLLGLGLPLFVRRSNRKSVA